MAAASIAAKFGNVPVDVVYAELYHEHDYDANRFRYQVIPLGSRSRNVSHWLGTPDISAEDNELLYNLASANGLIHKQMRAYHPEKSRESERLQAEMSIFQYQPAQKYAQYVSLGKRKHVKRQTAARKAGIKIAPYKSRQGVKKGAPTGARAGWRARKAAEEAKWYPKVVLKLRVPVAAPVVAPAAPVAAAPRPAPVWTIDLNESEEEEEEPPPPQPPPPPPPPRHIGLKDEVTVTHGAHAGEQGIVIGFDPEPLTGKDDAIVKMRLSGDIAILSLDHVKKPEADSDSDDEVVAEDSDGGESVDEGVVISALKGASVGNRVM